MEYLLLIYSPEKDLEKRSPADYAALNAEYMKLHGRPQGERPLQGRQPAPADLDGDDRAPPQRKGPEDGRPVRRDEGAARRLLPRGGEGPRRGARARGPASPRPASSAPID